MGVDLNTGLGSLSDAAGDTYVSIENVVGSSFDDSLFGNGLANKLDGGRGFDFLVGGAGNDTLLGGDNGDILRGGTGADVINGGGRDVLIYDNSVLGVNVNLSTGLATGGDAEGDTFTSIEDLSGSAGADILAGTTSGNFLSGNSGSDRLFGFAGNDTIDGDGGADTMTGGDGADTFFFNFQEESPAGFFTRDVIQDFRHAQGDVLNLHEFDANTDSPGFDSFEFLGKDGSFDAPGQIRYVFENNTTVVQINTAGGDVPEMEIQLQGNIDLVASDFLLSRRGGPPQPLLLSSTQAGRPRITRYSA